MPILLINRTNKKGVYPGLSLSWAYLYHLQMGQLYHHIHYCQWILPRAKAVKLPLHTAPIAILLFRSYFDSLIVKGDKRLLPAK